MLQYVFNLYNHFKINCGKIYIIDTKYRKASNRMKLLEELYIIDKYWEFSHTEIM